MSRELGPLGALPGHSHGDSMPTPQVVAACRPAHGSCCQLAAVNSGHTPPLAACGRRCRRWRPRFCCPGAIVQPEASRPDPRRALYPAQTQNSVDPPRPGRCMHHCEGSVAISKHPRRLAADRCGWQQKVQRVATCSIFERHNCGPGAEAGDSRR